MAGGDEAAPPKLPFGSVDGTWNPSGRRRLVDNAELEQMRPLIPDIAASLGRGLQRLAPDAALEQVLAALWRDGAVIVERAVSEACCDRTIEEMTPYLGSQGYGDDFGGKTTERLGGVVARAPSSCEIVGHPLLIKLCEAILGRQLLNMTGEELMDTFPVDVGDTFHKERDPHDARVFHPYQCHLHQIIHIGAGGAVQPIHRDGGFTGFEFGPGIETEISTIWALSEFTEEVGPTRVVPGSHRWDRRRSPDLTPESDEWAQAVMPKGSVIIYLSHTLHSGGENRTPDLDRWGLNVDYCPAWMRQEVNQYLDVPPPVAMKLPRDIQQLIGYSMGSSNLGYVDGGKGPTPEENLDQQIDWATPEGFYQRAFASGGSSSKSSSSSSSSSSSKL
jgi:hypothetical protein